MASFVEVSSYVFSPSSVKFRGLSPVRVNVYWLSPPSIMDNESIPASVKVCGSTPSNFTICVKFSWQSQVFRMLKL